MARLAFVLPLLLAACPKISASGSASANLGATVSVPDPPENTAAPVDDLDNPSSKLSACARGDLSGNLAIVGDFRDSCHEMIICGGLTTSFSGAGVQILLNAATGKPLRPSQFQYLGDGRYKVGDVMTLDLVLGKDTTWGKTGDKITFDVLDLSSYFTKAVIKATASIDLSGRTTTSLEMMFEGTGPGVELLGLGTNPSSGVKADLDTVAKSLGTYIQVGNDIVVNDQHGDSTIAYHLMGPPHRFGELLGHAPQDMKLVDVNAARGAQTITVTDWGMQYQPGSSGTLDGTIVFEVKGGDFPYRAKFSYPHRKTPDIELSCL